MRYYQDHEFAYQEIQELGLVGWDRQRTLNELLNFPYKKHLSEVLSGLESPQVVLDLGCGTGPVSLWLATKGHQVTGIDVSPTAIDLAKKFSAKLSVSPSFVCSDFLTDSQLPKNFSLIVDSSFLHCIVFDEDRAKCLQRISDLLLPGGKLVIHTMVSDLPAEFGSEFELDESGILWFLGDSARVDESRIHPRGFATPQRRILSAAELCKELFKAGFAKEESLLIAGNKSMAPAVFFGVFNKPTSETQAESRSTINQE